MDIRAKEQLINQYLQHCRYAKGLNDDRYKAKSVKGKIASLKAFFNYLSDEEIIENNPFAKLRVKIQEFSLMTKIIPLTTTTQIYTHVTSKKQRDILATKHPRNKINI